jgi:hypothetical protein
MPLMSGAEHIEAFQCIGCGRIEAPQACIGVCEDRKVHFVYANRHEAALAQLRQVEERVRTLGKVVRQIASITPRAGEWERSYRALQEQARRALSGTAVK